MKFLQPQFLFVLPAVWVGLGLLLWLADRQRLARLRRLVGDPGQSWADSGRSARRQRWDIVLLFGAITALFTTLARPLYFHFDERSETQGAPYLLALDVSRSMLADDLKPTRYAAATNALDRFFAESRADHIGLITFAGIGYLNAPLTYDTRALRTILSYLNPTALLDPGSSMASAMDRAARYFTSNAVPQRTLILMSDGEELDHGQALQLARRLQRDHNITIHTVGVGTASGASIPAFRAPLQPTRPWGANFRPGLITTQMPAPSLSGEGPRITSKLDENNLRRIANAGRGRYFRLGQNGEGLDQLRSEVLRPLAKTAARGDLQNYREGYFVPLGLAVVANILKLLLGADRFRHGRALPSILGAKP